MHRHQLHLLLRHDLLPATRHNLQPLPHRPDHDPRQRLLHAHLLLHDRALWPQNIAHLWCVWHAGVRVHRRHSRHRRRQERHHRQGRNRVYLHLYLLLRLDLGPGGLGGDWGNLPAADSLTRGGAVDGEQLAVELRTFSLIQK